MSALGLARLPMANPLTPHTPLATRYTDTLLYAASLPDYASVVTAADWRDVAAGFRLLTTFPPRVQWSNECATERRGYYVPPISSGVDPRCSIERGVMVTNTTRGVPNARLIRNVSQWSVNPMGRPRHHW